MPRLSKLNYTVCLYQTFLLGFHYSLNPLIKIPGEGRSGVKNIFDENDTSLRYLYSHPISLIYANTLIFLKSFC